MPARGLLASTCIKVEPTRHRMRYWMNASRPGPRVDPSTELGVRRAINRIEEQGCDVIVRKMAGAFERLVQRGKRRASVAPSTSVQTAFRSQQRDSKFQAVRGSSPLRSNSCSRPFSAHEDATKTLAYGSAAPRRRRVDQVSLPRRRTRCLPPLSFRVAGVTERHRRHAQETPPRSRHRAMRAVRDARPATPSASRHRRRE